MDPSRWFKNSKRSDEVEIGAVFQHRLNAGGGVEKAKVLGLTKDSMGVPHVTYELLVEGRYWGAYQDRRTLGLHSFSQRFERTG